MTFAATARALRTIETGVIAVACPKAYLATDVPTKNEHRMMKVRFSFMTLAP
jgi:hypothetical protein